MLYCCGGENRRIIRFIFFPLIMNQGIKLQFIIIQHELMVEESQDSTKYQQKQEEISLTHQISTKLIQSNDFQSYFDYFYEFMKNQSQRDALILQLQSNGVTYEEESNNLIKQQPLLTKQCLNSEVNTIQMEIGPLKMNISILILEMESPLHKLNAKHQGSFGKIYVLPFMGKEIAVKCIHLQNMKKRQIKFNTCILKEYFISRIASILKIGPHIQAYFGCDIVIYEDCFQFTMEYCSQLNETHHNIELIANNLKQALMKLHTLQIIHFDIKPENICYSNEYQRYVFIDFGLSSFIRQKPGQLTTISFKGSVANSSPAMLNLFSSQENGQIDAYYNDLYGLRCTLAKIEALSLLDSTPSPQEQQFKGLPQTKFNPHCKSSQQKEDEHVLYGLRFLMGIKKIKHTHKMYAFHKIREVSH